MGLDLPFLSRSARPQAQCNLAIGGVSVRPSHAGTESKLITIGSCGFRHQVAQISSIPRPTFIPSVPGEHPL